MTNGPPTSQGAALTERAVIGEAWRRGWLDAGLPYLATSSDVQGLLAIGREHPTKASLVVLVDIPLGTASVVEALRAAGVHILLLAPTAMSPPVRGALRSGVDGMITLGDPLLAMRSAIAALSAGRSYASPSAARLLFDEHRLRPDDRLGAVDIVLSGRERAVLQAMVDGMTNKATARYLGISPKTVEAHRSRIYVRLRVSTQSEAVTLALTDERILGRVGSDPPA